MTTRQMQYAHLFRQQQSLQAKVQEWQSTGYLYQARTIKIHCSALRYYRQIVADIELARGLVKLPLSASEQYVRRAVMRELVFNLLNAPDQEHVVDYLLRVERETSKWFDRFKHDGGGSLVHNPFFGN